MIALAALLLGAVAAGASPSQDALPGPAPGVSHRTFACAPQGRPLRFEELRFEPGHGLWLEAARNPGAHPDARCRDGYGGPDLEALLRSGLATGGERVLGAANGTVFRAIPGGYASNSLLWSRDRGLLAPLRKGGGAQVLVADASGGHTSPIRESSTGKLLARLRAEFPTMSVALQSNMPLMGGKPAAGGGFEHWSRCRRPDAADWRCRSLARTVLCARRDGSISLLTTPEALPLELARGLGPGGACGTECESYYNLDGGGSTQLAWLEGGSSTKAIYKTSGRRMETSEAGCSPLRPVDNYLLIVSRPARPAAPAAGGPADRRHP